MKKFYMVLAGTIVAAGSIFLFNFLGGVSKAALPEDCDNNSIIYCGGTTSSTLASRYKANKTGDLPAIYGAYGLSAHDMTNAGTVAKMGEVTKDGRVVVGGKTVATGAKSIGRHNMSGSTKKVIAGKTFYERTTATSFRSNSIVAYVFFDANGDFRTAVLTSCGNPVTATKPVYKCESLTHKAITRTKYSFVATASASNGATITGYTYDFGDGKKANTTAKTIDHEYAAPGKYTVKLTVTVKVNGTTKTITGPNCQVNVEVEKEPATPVYTCDSLTSTKISRLESSFTGKATVSGGAVIENYVIDFGDSKTETVTNPTNVRHTYAKEGEYTAKLTVNVKVNNETKAVTGPNCIVKVTLSPDECKPGIPVGHKDCEEKPEECKPGIPVGDERCTPCETPGKEHLSKNDPACEEVPVELPKTGPADMLFGAFGLGSVAAAAYYYAASRRGLFTELLNR